MDRHPSTHQWNTALWILRRNRKRWNWYIRNIHQSGECNWYRKYWNENQRRNIRTIHQIKLRLVHKEKPETCDCPPRLISQHDSASPAARPQAALPSDSEQEEEHGSSWQFAIFFPKQNWDDTEHWKTKIAWKHQLNITYTGLTKTTTRNSNPNQTVKLWKDRYKTNTYSLLLYDRLILRIQKLYAQNAQQAFSLMAKRKSTETPFNPKSWML